MLSFFSEAQGSASIVSRFLKEAEELLFPRRCVGCHSPGFYLCPSCSTKISYLTNQFCPTCQRPAVDGFTHPYCKSSGSLDGLISVAFYQEPIRSLIKQLKYGRVRNLDGVILEIFNDFLVEEESLFSSSSIVVSVPLHFFKKNERGFNQSEILAKAVAEVLNLKFAPNLLKRQKNTSSQTKLSRKERARNVDNAFAINENESSTRGNDFILVDDVWTTGSTIKECGRILKKGGVRTVWGLTLAREEKILDLGKSQ